MDSPASADSASDLSAPRPATRHVSVLLAEVLEWLDPRPGQTLIDGTLGGAGHTRALAERVVPGGEVLALDRDPRAVKAAEPLRSTLPVRPLWSNFSDIPEVLEQLGIPAVDGVLLDLGLSSDQLADRERGFSFDADGPLDLRFNPLEGKPATHLLARLSEQHLADLIYQYGEERASRRIARKIVERRRLAPIETARQLADLVRGCVRRGPHDRIDPATRTFQALRIAVNEELRSLDVALRRIADYLKPGGRLAVISFHSLEDRRVKTMFREDPRYEPLTRKPIRPSDVEARENPRARSAKLRVAQRTDAPASDESTAVST